MTLPPPLERAVVAFCDGPPAVPGVLVEARSELPDTAEAVVVPVVGEGDGEDWRVVALAPGRVLDTRSTARLGRDAGEAVLVTPSDPRAPLEVIVGLGPAGSVDAEALRRAGAAAARRLADAAEVVADLRGLAAVAERAGTATPGAAGAAGAGGTTGGRVPAVARLVQGFVEGFELACYRYDGYRAEAAQPAAATPAATPPRRRGGRPPAGVAPTPPARRGRPERMVVVCEESGAAELGAERAATIAAGVRLARDLINTPAGDCTPRGMAEVARRLAAHEGLAIEVVDADEAARLGLGGLLGVGRGSTEPPVLVRLTYEPDVDPPAGGRATLALVGKGITFDSGGLSLKDPGPMMTMKTDMSGAADVLATLACCGRLGVDKRVVGFMPLTENMPSGSATKPGDVVRMRNGTTVEVLNTDAEGRLVLADALSLAVEMAPDAIVDLATLTGAVVTALGRSVAGVMGTDDGLLSAIEAAAARAGEAVWRLPLPEIYRPKLDSEVAQLKNIGPTGEAGSVIAGIFLQEFTGGLPWAHLDIAGVARSEEDVGYVQKGATGWGVRTLVELLEGPLEPRHSPEPPGGVGSAR
jgi:leucyl aminopeptidase